MKRLSLFVRIEEVMIGVDDATVTPTDEITFEWADLAGRVQRFLSSWNETNPPSIADFAPPEPPALRRIVLCELIKIELEQRASREQRTRPIEEYVKEFPELVADSRIPCDLIYEEFAARRRAGEDVSPEEYYERFPQQTNELRRLLASSVTATTCLVPPTQAEVFAAGQQVDDFDLIAQLGKGAFATVFLARQRSLQRMVALKISVNRGSEPQTLAQLDHPNIVRVYDQRILASTDLRLLYMQYAPGGTLLEVVDRMRRVPWDRWRGGELLGGVDAALDLRGESPPNDSSLRRKLASASWAQVVSWFGVQLASALDYAHARGVLHRDIKPANILLTAEGAPKLADFNISFCSKVDGASPAAYFGGSLAYMSPEQLEACNPSHDRRPEELDGRSDLFSLGVVLWELLTGKRPYPDLKMNLGWEATLEQLHADRAKGPDVSLLRRSSFACPRALEEVLLKLLAFHREERFINAAEAVRELRLCQQPEAQHLLQRVSSGWQPWVRKLPLTSIIAAAVVPNIIAAVFNYFYNREMLEEHLPNAIATFHLIVTVINGVAFPLGIALVAALARPIVQSLKGKVPPQAGGAERHAFARRRSLLLGHYVGMVSIAEWTVAGFVYPIVMALVGTGMSTAEAMQFIGSLTLCGLIAAVYPCLLVSAMGVEVFYPGLLRPHWPTPEELPDLARLHARTGRYLGLAVALPLLGVALLVLTGGENRLAMGILSVGGFVALWPAFILARRIQRDVNTLAGMLEVSSEQLSTGTESFRQRFS